MIQQGRAKDAEACLRRVLEIDPNHREANERLAILLQIEGRTWEALPYAQAVVRGGKCGRDLLLMIGGVDTVMVQDVHFVETCVADVPEDPLVLLGRGRLKQIENCQEEADAIYRRIIDNDSTQVEAQARLGELCLEHSDPASFLRWHAALPDNVDAHPLIWFVRGLWARRNDQPLAAIRCFLEALRLHPNHSGANFQLAQTLVSVGRVGEAEAFAERARILSTLEAWLHELRGIADLNMMRQASETCEQLGRLHEATGWCDVALNVDPETTWARTRLVRLTSGIVETHEFTLASAQPALAWDVSKIHSPAGPRSNSAAPDLWRAAQ